LKFDESIQWENIRLYRLPAGIDEVGVQRETGSADLGEFSPQIERSYRLVIYRRAPAFDTEPQFALRVRDEDYTLLDKEVVRPTQPSKVNADLQVITPTTAIQQPNLQFRIVFTPTVPGRYVLTCHDALQMTQEISGPIYAMPGRQIPWSCPAADGEPGSWSGLVYPYPHSNHPDTQKDLNELSPLASQPFRVAAAEHSVEVSKTQVFDPDPTGSVVGVRYVVTNTGNLSDAVWIAYRPISHALTATLFLTDTLGQPYSVTLPFTDSVSLPLLPEGQSVDIGQAVEVEIIVVHDARLVLAASKTLDEPIEFVIHFIPHAGQGDPSERREKIEVLP
jgi:hypothetical protein